MPSNFARTGILLIALTAIFVVTGGLIGGQSGMVIAFIAALVMNALSFWNSDKVVLRMFRAQEVDARTAPELHQMVAALAERADLPMPRVYIMESDQPNAFATGRNPANSAVCASTGLLNSLSREEVAGVMAHELAHIKNRDTLTMTVAATIGGAITMLVTWMQYGMLFGMGRDRDGRAGMLGILAAIILAPLAATIVQMAISRSREYQADRMGALICGDPHWLSSALARIHNAAARIPNPLAERAPAAAHVFIINPLSGRGMDNLFSTHPNVENRIAELDRLAAELAAEGGAAPAGPWSGSARPGRNGSAARSHGPWG